MPATEREVEQLLECAITGDAYQAFGLHKSLRYSLTQQQLEAECIFFNTYSTKTREHLLLFRKLQMPMHL